MKIFKNNQRCVLCNSKNLKTLKKLKPVPLGDQYFNSIKKSKKHYFVPMTILMCNQCSNVQVKEIIDPKFLWKDYTYLSSQTKAIVNHFKEFSNLTIKKFNLNKDDLVIDIGSNDGSLLKFFKNKKIKVLGVDPAPNVAKIAEKQGIKTLVSLFNKKITNKISKFFPKPKMITAFNVFAHTDQMIDLIKNIKKISDKKTVFIFEVQYLDDILKKKILGTFIHEHISHYSITSLNNFFRDHGFVFFDVIRVNIQKGSIIGFVSLDNDKKQSTRIKKLLTLEKKNGLNKSKKISKFFEFVDQNKYKVSKIINKEKLNKISAYGAARSGALFTENYEFGKKINFIFDDHYLKVKKYSPINSAKVLPSKKLSIKNTSLCAITAYLHAKKIVRNHKAFLMEGGKFLILHPKVMLLDINNYKNFI